MNTVVSRDDDTQPLEDQPRFAVEERACGAPSGPTSYFRSAASAPNSGSCAITLLALVSQQTYRSFATCADPSAAAATYDDESNMRRVNLARIDAKPNRRIRPA